MIAMQTETIYLNGGSFWGIYDQAPGRSRRLKLLSVFAQNPTGRLPVNNKWQATTQDPDLSRLIKQGKLKQIRSGGCRQHPQNRSSNKRQSYLVLAVEPQQAV